MAEEHVVKITTTADTSGAEKTAEGMEKVNRAASKTARESKIGFEQLKSGVGQVTGALGVLRNIMTGFGIVGLVMPVVQIFKSWHDEIKRTEERAKALREELANKAAAAEIKRVADGYRDLKNAIAAASEARSRENELFSEEVRLRREAEDADSAAAEADALAGVDPNADDADEQRARIRETFAANRARTSATRKKEDVILRRQALLQQSEDDTEAADKLSASLEGDDRNIVRARTRASTLERLSTMTNDRDGTWYSRTKRTAEGDAERDRLRKEAEAARQEAQRLEDSKAEKERQIAELRARSEHAGKMRDVLFAGIETAETERATVTVNQNASEAIAKAKDDRKSAKYADAVTAQEMLSREKVALEARINEEREKKAAAGQRVFSAQGAADLARSNGDSRSVQSAALQNLQAAQGAAQEVDFAADKAINALTKALKSVEERLKKAQSYIESQSKQTRSFMDEAPAGV